MDIGFGDVIIPRAMRMEFPTLLEEKPPRIKVYSIESIISEKFEAMVKLAMVNSRMKDFYDIYPFLLVIIFKVIDLKRQLNLLFIEEKPQSQITH